VESVTISVDFIPPDLSEEELTLWKQLAPRLIELEIVNSLNYVILVRYCKLYLKTQALTEKRPYHTGLPQLNRQLKLLEEELCLSPSAFNKFLKDRLIIEERQRKAEKHKQPTEDEVKEGFFT
jgi:hypothetical protein